MATRFSFHVRPDARQGDLTAMIAAHLMYERMIAARVFLVHVLAVIGLLLWAEAMWPPHFSDQTRAVTGALWGTCSLLTLGVVTLEWFWRRTREHRLDEYQSPPRGKES